MSFSYPNFDNDAPDKPFFYHLHSGQPDRIYLDNERLSDPDHQPSAMVDEQLGEWREYIGGAKAATPPEFLWCEGGGTCWAFHTARPRFVIEVTDEWDKILWLDGCDDETRDILVAKAIDFASDELIRRIPHAGKN